MSTSHTCLLPLEIPTQAVQEKRGHTIGLGRQEEHLRPTSETEQIRQEAEVQVLEGAQSVEQMHHTPHMMQHLAAVDVWLQPSMITE